MLDSLLDIATASPWIYVALLAFAALDAVLPVVPSEASVISAGALAGSGELELGLVVACAAAGAVLGDNGAFAAGRFLRPRLEPRIARNERAARRRAWAERKLDACAPALVILSRFVPGGRTATTTTAGLVGLRWPRFVRLTLLAGVAWASYAALLGYAGGATFEEHPALGLALGFGLALAGTAAISFAVRPRAFGDATDASPGAAAEGEAMTDESVKVESALTGGDAQVLSDPPTFAFRADDSLGPHEPAAARRPDAAAGLDPNGARS
jgi:membrane protein DedA with SNARE-associated domain